MARRLTTTLAAFALAIMAAFGFLAINHSNPAPTIDIHLVVATD
ncbi:hypothetical protein [Actinoalloteichus spitiensis]|nr:hypothetical protein [Actinoalloteichus spitiensis]